MMINRDSRQKLTSLFFTGMRTTRCSANVFQLLGERDVLFADAFLFAFSTDRVRASDEMVE